MNPKQILRKKILLLRKSLSPVEREEKSRTICEKLASLDGFRNAKNILFYHPLDTEVNISPLLVRTLAKREKNVFLPRLEKDRNISVRPYQIGDKLITNYHNIREPLASTDIFSKQEIDLAIIPCVAADREGFRLGFGAGCYDRFLADFEKTSVLLAFDVQIVKKVPRENHDQATSILITED